MKHGVVACLCIYFFLLFVSIINKCSFIQTGIENWKGITSIFIGYCIFSVIVLGFYVSCIFITFSWDCWLRYSEGALDVLHVHATYKYIDHDQFSPHLLQWVQVQCTLSILNQLMNSIPAHVGMLICKFMFVDHNYSIAKLRLHGLFQHRNSNISHHRDGCLCLKASYVCLTI